MKNFNDFYESYLKSLNIIKESEDDIQGYLIKFQDNFSFFLKDECDIYDDPESSDATAYIDDVKKAYTALFNKWKINYIGSGLDNQQTSDWFSFQVYVPKGSLKEFLTDLDYVAGGTNSDLLLMWTKDDITSDDLDDFSTEEELYEALKNHDNTGVYYDDDSTQCNGSIEKSAAIEITPNFDEFSKDLDDWFEEIVADAQEGNY